MEKERNQKITSENRYQCERTRTRNAQRDKRVTEEYRKQMSRHKRLEAEISQYNQEWRRSVRNLMSRSYDKHLNVWHTPSRFTVLYYS